MGTRDKSKIFTTRGKLVINATGKTTGGDELGYTDEGVELVTGEIILKEQVEEEGGQNAKWFYGGQNAQLIFTLRQWDDEVLATRFPNQFNVAKSRIQLPGDRVPGDDLDAEAVSVMLRPDDTSKDPYIFARKAILVGAENEPIRFRTTQSRRLALVFDLLPDEGVSSGAADEQYKYRTLVIAKEADWTFA